MRTLVLTLLFLVLVVPSALASGSSPDEPPQVVQEADTEAAQEAAPEAAAEAAPEATEEAPADASKPQAALQDEPTGPVGEIHLHDGSVIEVMGLKRFGKYYIYVSGKLNGRSAMVISLTRLSDLRQWTGLAFKDQNTFTLVTKSKKELNFTDGHVYLGTDSTTDYTFIATNANSYMTEETSVKKSDVKLFLIK